MGSYEAFIPQNAAPKGAEKIGIYDANGIRVGELPLGSLRPRAKGERLYSFGVLSDTHIKDAGHAHTKMFKDVLEKLCADDEVSFVCVLGDNINENPENYGLVEEVWWQGYKDLIENHAAGKPVYSITGNHDSVWMAARTLSAVRDEDGNVVTQTDAEGNVHVVTDSEKLSDPATIEAAKAFVRKYMGCDTYYKFEHGGDVFLMLGLYRIYGPKNAQVYKKEDIAEIYRLFEENRNKRCFVMTHIPPNENLVDYDLEDEEDYPHLPLSMFRHYRNSVVFHGHTHGQFSNQESDAAANYTETLGFRSVHTPMTCIDEDTGRAEVYVVDVYENGIHLRGYDFLKEKSVPLGTFWLDTPLVEIEAGTYVDENGAIIKNKEE